MENKELIELAIKVRENAYVPNSKFKVGVALLCKSGKVYTGCNVENGFTGPSICAERVAIAKAISEGDKEFQKLVIVAAKEGENLRFITPCGGCRQFLNRFCSPDFEIICAYKKEEKKDFTLKSFRLEELLPYRYER